MPGSTVKLYVRTPLIQSLPLAKYANADVYMKLENTQPSGSFKMRGISNLIEKHIANGKRRFVIASGGNAGLASAYCARKLGVPITVCVSHSTAQCSVDLLKAEGATVTVHGHCWDDSNVLALEMAAKDPDCTYIHPFDDELVWEGHASMVEEIQEDLPVKPDLVVTSIGGGGLLCGVVRGMDRVGWGDVPILGMETVGCDSYNNAIKHGQNISLGKITSLATCLAALTPAQQAFDYYYKRPIISEVITDKQCVEACSLFLDDHRMLVEPACGAALAAFYSGVISKLQTDQLSNVKTIVIIVCGGAGISLPQLNTFRTQVGL